MSENRFLKVLQELPPQDLTPLKDIFRILMELVEAINQLNPETLKAELERGISNGPYGQEWRIVVSSTKKGYWSQVLFRTYVNIDHGWPVRIDHSGGGLEKLCNEEELVAFITKNVLGNEDEIKWLQSMT